MESSDNCSKQPQSTISQRNVDKELQRIKNLGVVTVINKTLNASANAIKHSSLAIVSPSSSPANDQNENSRHKARSQSVSYHTISSTSSSLKSHGSSLSFHSDQNKSKAPVRQISDVRSIFPTEEGADDINPALFAEKKTDDNELVIDSPIDNGQDEALERRVQELQMLYNASVKELQAAESRNSTQGSLMILQEKLIAEMSYQIEQTESTQRFMEESYTTSQVLATDEDRQAFVAVRKDAMELRSEMDAFEILRSQYDSLLSNMSEKLSMYDQKMDEMEQLAENIQKGSAAQALCIDNNVQTLLDKILEMNKTVNRLEDQLRKEREASLSKEQEHISKDSGIKSLKNSSSITWEDERGDGEHSDYSTRSSYISDPSTNDGQQRKLLVARWKGGSIPPPSPPPAMPLPPIPNNSERRPKSTMIAASKDTTASNLKSKHVSMDAVGGPQRRLSSQSEINPERTDEEYYKEFTDQLQERLSISKEIDDLSDLKLNDYDQVQKKVESNDWPVSGDETNPKDQNAFWKSMKKRLKV